MLVTVPVLLTIKYVNIICALQFTLVLVLGLLVLGYVFEGQGEFIIENIFISFFVLGQSICIFLI